MNLRDLARRLRRRQTSAESKLWHKLRNRKLAGFKFRRQHPLEGFIVDFYCAEHKLVIEVDGDSHVGRGARDRARTRRLEQAGYCVIRFRNREVQRELGSVLQAIHEACLRGRNPHPNPSP